MEFSRSYDDEASQSEERLRQTAEAYIAALQLGEALDRSNIQPSETEYEVSVNSMGDIPLPDELRQIDGQFRSITILSERLKDDDRVTLTLIFYIGKYVCRLEHPAYDISTDFHGKVDVKQSVYLTSSADIDESNELTISTDSVAHYLSHAIHTLQYQAELPLDDPLNCKQVAMAIDTISERSGEPISKTSDYELSVENGPYEVTVIRRGHEVVGLNIKHTMLNDVVNDGEHLRETFHILHARLHFGDFQTGISYQLETDETLENLQPTLEMIQDTIDTLRTLITYADQSITDEPAIDPTILEQYPSNDKDLE